MTRQNCAVVLFERDERAEAREKQLPRRLLGLLRRRLERQVRRIEGVDLWIAASRGADFSLRGSRSVQAFDAPGLADQLNATAGHLRSAGYHHVVFLATDVAVSPQALWTAIDGLRKSERNVVIGESGDGGFYLFGYAGQAVALDWNVVPLHSDRAAAELRRLIGEEGRAVTIIPPADDLDECDSVLRFVADLRLRGLNDLASAVLAGPQKSFPAASAAPIQSIAQRVSPPFRGPPIA